MRHIISILMENEPGALSRVAGLFSARIFSGGQWRDRAWEGGALQKKKNLSAHLRRISFPRQRSADGELG